MAIRTGLIGYGLGGAAFHAPLIATTPGLTLEAIVTTNPERRAQAERAYPGVRLLSSADELFTRPRPVDLVVVTTPNRSHIPLAMSALGAGLPVVIDKPVAPTSAAATTAAPTTAASSSAAPSVSPAGQSASTPSPMADSSPGR